MGISNTVSGFFEKTWSYFSQEKTRIYTLAGGVGGGILSARLFIGNAHFWTYINLDTALKTSIAIVSTFVMGFATRAGAKLFDKLEPKIKFFKNGKQKDNERRA
jgi:hypothetical protein